jgi:hypothetical protein
MTKPPTMTMLAGADDAERRARGFPLKQQDGE